MEKKNEEGGYRVEECIHFLRHAEKIMSSCNAKTGEYEKSPAYLIDGLKIAEETLECFNFPWLRVIPYIHAVGMLYFAQVKGNSEYRMKILELLIELVRFATFLERTREERREIAEFAAREIARLEESLKNAPASPAE